MKRSLIIGFLALLVARGASAQITGTDPDTALKAGDRVTVTRSFAFGDQSPTRKFQHGQPTADADIDEEAPYCTFSKKISNSANPALSPNRIIWVTETKRVVVQGLAGEAYRLQKDPELSLLICWGIGLAYPTREQIMGSLGEYVRLPAGVYAE